MITGSVQDDEARIRLRIRGTGGRELEIVAIVDTGYTGELTLPAQVIADLGLRWLYHDSGTLADGSECLFDVYDAAVWWDRRLRPVLVDEADAAPLVGMALMAGYKLTVEVQPRGRVEIRRMR